MKKNLTVLATIVIGSLVIGTTAFANVTVNNNSAYKISYDLAVHSTIANPVFTTTVDANGKSTSQTVGVMVNNGQALGNSCCFTGVIQAGKKLVVSETGMQKTVYGQNEMNLSTSVSGQTIFSTPLYNYGGLSMEKVTGSGSQIVMLISADNNVVNLAGGMF